MEYRAACAAQEQWAGRVERGETPGVLLLAEHPPVLTVGRLAEAGDLGREIEDWRGEGVEVAPTNRGGKITFHGPGQIVLYPILDLKRIRIDLHRYIRQLEEVGIRFLASYGVECERDPEHTGVWAPTRDRGLCKVAAIGIHVRRYVTTHGMAINVNNPSEIFGRFVPCGIRGRGVVSLAEILGAPVDLPEARHRVVAAFQEVFREVLTVR
jgi:lipoyl(octanoyl) transferase